MSNVSVELKTPVAGAFQQPTGLFINNEFVEGVEKKTFEVINPATEEVICSVHEATEKDVDVAVAVARKAFEGPWRRTTPAQRGMHLMKLADLCEKNTDLLAAVESLDNGKSITMARGDVGAAISTIRYYAGWADKIEGKTIDVNPDTFHYTRREPVSALRRSRKLTACRELTERCRSAFALRSSPGTSRCSCWRGKSALPLPRATLLS
jgi:aldehyde dehydrogenase (NAD+)